MVDDVVILILSDGDPLFGGLLDRDELRVLEHEPIVINVGSSERDLRRVDDLEAMCKVVDNGVMRLDRPSHDWSWTPGRRNKSKKR